MNGKYTLRRLAECKVGPNHKFPLFAGSDAKWWYVGHYQIKLDAEQDELAAAHIAKNPSYRFDTIAKNHPEAAQLWVEALAAPKCSWQYSLTTLQNDIYDPSNNFAPVFNYLQQKNLLVPEKGTLADRQEATRHLLKQGVLRVNYTWLQFSYYDDKLYRLLQDRASGKDAAKQQIWLPPKRASDGSTTSMGKRRKRGESTLVAKVRVAWPDKNGQFAWYDGTLYRDSNTEAHQFIRFFILGLVDDT